MLPGALPFTSSSAEASAVANNNLQAGRNFSSQSEFAWKYPRGVIGSM